MAERLTITARIEGEIAGVAILFPASADLAQLAVAPLWRRTGVTSALLAEAYRAASTPLRIVNVDASCRPAEEFLTAVGATRTVAQFEMLRPL